MKIIKLNNPNFNKDKVSALLEKNICFIAVFSKVCIHCENMKPEWNKLLKKLKKINCNAILLEIDANYLNNINNNIISKINGFPSILIYKNGKIVKDYNGNRSLNDMLKFFKPYMIVTDKTSKNIAKPKKKRKTKKITLCKNKKNNIDGCTICCSKFKKRKTYKNCIKLCMNN